MRANTKYMQAFRAKRLEQGLCIRCGKAPHRSGKKTCGCDLVYQRNRADKLSADGVCRRCRGPVDDGMQLCITCRAHDASRKAERGARRVNAGRCGKCGEEKSEPRLKWCQSCRDKERQIQKDVRLEVFAVYGTVCVCCGEAEPDFLTIDHVNGGGTKHRQSIGVGRRIYPWLKSMGYPDGYQVLCFNCNCGRKPDGRCPHKRKQDH